MHSPSRPHSLRTGAVVTLATFGAFACAVVLACLAHAGQRQAITAAREEAFTIATTAALSVDGAAHLKARDAGDRGALRLSRCVPGGPPSSARAPR